MSWATLHTHSHYSTLDGLSSPSDIAKRCKEIGITTAAITDHGNIAAAPSWLQISKKNGILGLIGIEFYVSKQLSTIQNSDNKSHTHLVLIAKNINGYKQLVKMVSRSNKKECFYYKNRLSLEEIADYITQDIIGICGHMGSTLGDVIIEEEQKDQWIVKDNWKKDGTNLINYFLEIFGEDNFGIEIQTYEGSRSGFKELIECNRELCKITGAIPISTADAHYACPDQTELQRILMCNQFKTTLSEVKQKETDLSIFFDSDRLYIPSREELESWGSTKEELDNTLLITKDCDEINLYRSPQVPKLRLPKGYNNSEDYLKALAIKGFKKRYPNVSKEKARQVAERFNDEFKQSVESGILIDYYLMVHDIIDWCHKNNIITGPGRGSCSGSLISYLLELTQVDPLEYGLIFERYYNAGRAEIKEDGSKIYHMPDFDLDIPSYARESIIEYLKERYGDENIGQVATFSTLKGRSAFKGVCRALGTISDERANEICQMMPEEHKIVEELKEMEENLGFSSIIYYCLDILKKSFAPYAQLNEDGSISGKYAKEFNYARKLEGVYRGTGVHASAIIINSFDDPLGEIVPMIKQKENDKVIGYSGPELESHIGLLKFDLLGLSELDKCTTFINYVNTGEYKFYGRT